MKDYKSLIITIGAVFLFSQIPSTLESTKSFDSKLKDILVTIEKNVPKSVSHEALNFGYQYLKTSSINCQIRFKIGPPNKERTEACEKWLQDAVTGLNHRFGDTHPFTRVILTDSTIPTTGHPRLSVVREGGVIYVKYKAISRRNFEDRSLLRHELNQVKNQFNKQPKLLVLDLRGNKGGYVEQAVEVADLFLASGRVATVSHYSDMATNKYWDAKPLPNNRWLEQIPIAIITDKKTASAAEIIVTALLDNGRAQIHIGETTFGKGVFQYSFNSDFFELKVTEGVVKRLKGGSYNKVGIIPRQRCDQPVKPTSTLSYACMFMKKAGRQNEQSNSL